MELGVVGKRLAPGCTGAGEELGWLQLFFLCDFIRLNEVLSLLIGSVITVLASLTVSIIYINLIC